MLLIFMISCHIYVRTRYLHSNIIILNREYAFLHKHVVASNSKSTGVCALSTAWSTHITVHRY